MAAIHQISSDFAPISTTPPPTQAQVVAALAQGRTVTAAALEAGIHRTTIHHWLRTQSDFKTAVEDAQHDYVATLTDDLRELSALALATLRSLLEDPATPPSIRLKASLAVLQRPQFPNQGWTLPERIESPRQFFDDLPEVEADYKTMRMTDAVKSHAASATRREVSPQPSGPQRPTPNSQNPPLRMTEAVKSHTASATPREVSSQPSGPQRPTPNSQNPPFPNSQNPPFPRCSPCPCGSGRKYKRCCGSAAPGLVFGLKATAPSPAGLSRSHSGRSPA